MEMEQMMAHLLAEMKAEITYQTKAGSHDTEQLRRNAGQYGNQPRKDGSQNRNKPRRMIAKIGAHEERMEAKMDA
jgi:hypothetical protein